MTGLPPEYAWLDPQDRALIDDAILAASKLPKEKKGEAYLDISKRLRVLRRHLGRTPESFAAALGMSKTAYLPYEKGQRGKREWTNMVPRIVYLGWSRPVSLNWLVTGEDGPGGERNDDLPLFIFPDGVCRPLPKKPLITDRSGNVVTVKFGCAS